MQTMHKSAKNADNAHYGMIMHIAADNCARDTIYNNLSYNLYNYKNRHKYA